VDRVVVHDPEGHPGMAYYARFLFTLRRERFDLVLILTPSFSSALMMFLAGIRHRVGYATDARGFLLTKSSSARGLRKKHLMEEYLDLVRSLGWRGRTVFPRLKPIPVPYFDPPKGRVLVALACGGTYGPAKQWMPESFARTARRLVSRPGTRIVLVGTDRERGAAEMIARMLPTGTVINRCGRTDLMALAELLRHCRVLLSNDTGVMHLAAAVGTPVVAVFGSTSPVWTGPLGRRSRAVSAGLKCSPCFKRVCPRGDVPYECLKKITPDLVAQEVIRMMKGAR
jgi:heptosyltransferase-2